MTKKLWFERALARRWTSGLAMASLWSLVLACSSDGDGSAPATSSTGGAQLSPKGGSSAALPGTGGVSTGGTASGGSGGSPAAGNGGLSGGSPPSTGGVTPNPQAGSAGGGAAGAPSTGGAAGGGGKSTGGTGGAPIGGSAGKGGGANGGTAQGGAGGAAGGSGGGSTGFDPCPPAGTPCKILPLGDSITDGIGTSVRGGGYRVELFSKAVADNKTITFVGGSMNGPDMVAGKPFPRSHEGHSGWTIGRVDTDIIPMPALNPDPHIVLVHLGTNDMYQMPSGADTRLGMLMDQIISELPNALLVVSSIITYPPEDDDVKAFNAKVPGLVMSRASAGKHVIFVDQYQGFPESELSDGIHPNNAGYDRMGTVWYNAIKSYLH
jgi:lysophospholipase L1-like esterase